MTEEQVGGLVAALRSHLDSYGSYLGGDAVQKHVDVYCRGLISDLPRKSVEPIALAAVGLVGDGSARSDLGKWFRWTAARMSGLGRGRARAC